MPYKKPMKLKLKKGGLHKATGTPKEEKISAFKLAKFAVNAKKWAYSHK